MKVKVMEFNNLKGAIFNEPRRSFVKPKESEEFCPVCRGTGRGREGDPTYAGTPACRRCGGRGIIDWIDKVMR